MPKPQVLDAKGKVLEVGSRVKRGDDTGTVVFLGVRRYPFSRVVVDVDWGDDYSERLSGLWVADAYRCPDLTLITDDESPQQDEAVTTASERSSA